MDISGTIILGIVSGVLTSAVILSVQSWFRQIVLPWYQRLVYRGIDITGDWHCLDFGLAQEIVLVLRQRAHAIEGTASFMRHSDKEPTGAVREWEPLRTFHVSGQICDRFVWLLLRHSDTQRLGIHSYLLEVNGDGRRMDGVFVFYGVGASRAIRHHEQVLFRDRNIAEHRYQQERERHQAGIDGRHQPQLDFGEKAPRRRRRRTGTELVNKLADAFDPPKTAERKPEVPAPPRTAVDGPAPVTGADLAVAESSSEERRP